MKVEFLKAVILKPYPNLPDRLNAKIGSVYEVDDAVAEQLMDRGLAIPARRDAELTASVIPPKPAEKEVAGQVSQSTPAASDPAPSTPSPKVRAAVKSVATRVRQASPMAVRPVEAPVGEGGGLAEKLAK